MIKGQTDVIESKGTTEDDFLARERAMLGEDADQFATPQDHAAGNEGVEGGDDLLGGRSNDTHGEEIGQFESSFPSMETQAQNEVRTSFGVLFRDLDYADLKAPPFSELPLMVQSPALALLSLLPGISDPRSPKKSPSLFGKENPRSKLGWRMSSGACF